MKFVISQVHTVDDTEPLEVCHRVNIPRHSQSKIAETLKCDGRKHLYNREPRSWWKVVLKPQYVHEESIPYIRNPFEFVEPTREEEVFHILSQRKNYPRPSERLLASQPCQSPRCFGVKKPKPCPTCGHLKEESDA